jgi:hypothetical protein
MARDHTIKGSPYIECGICAKTIRKSDATLQRGILVGPECVDDDPYQGPIEVSEDDNQIGHF